MYNPEYADPSLCALRYTTVSTWLEQHYCCNPGEFLLAFDKEWVGSELANKT
jgi:hypothetical protein